MEEELNYIEELASSIKKAEQSLEQSLDKKSESPFVARLDGVAFRTYTSKLKKPFDQRFTECMKETTRALMKHFQPSLGFVQSDEISLIFANHAKLYNGRVVKLASILAGAASAYFAVNAQKLGLPIGAFFDGRLVQYEPEKVIFWRASDLRRNSVNSIAQSHYGYQKITNIPMKQLQNSLESHFGSLDVAFGKDNLFGTIFKKHYFSHKGYDPIKKETVFAQRSTYEGRSIDLLTNHVDFQESSWPVDQPYRC